MPSYTGNCGAQRVSEWPYTAWLILAPLCLFLLSSLLIGHSSDLSFLLLRVSSERARQRRQPFLRRGTLPGIGPHGTFEFMAHPSHVVKRASSHSDGAPKFAITKAALHLAPGLSSTVLDPWPKERATNRGQSSSPEASPGLYTRKSSKFWPSSPNDLLRPCIAQRERKQSEA